jgi:outer membrane protein
MKNRKHTLYLFAFLSWLAITGASAQSSTRYSLQELIDLALKNNELVRNADLEVETSEYRVKEARGALLPRLDMNGQYLYYMELPSQYAPASAFGGPEGEYAKLTLNLPQTVSANLQSTANIFNKVVFTGLKTAKVHEEGSKLQLVATKEEVIYNVTATYYTIQVLEDNLNRLTENIANLEKTVSINETLKSNELVSDNVHHRLLINLENLRNQYEIQKLNHSQQETLLGYLVNLGPEEKIALEPFDYGEVIESPSYTDLSNRSDIRLQEMTIRLSEYDKKNAAAAFYPTLTGGLSYGVASYYNEFAPGKQLNNDWIKSQSFSLNLKIPILDGFQRNYKVKQKQIAIDKNRNTLNMMKSKAAKEIEDASNNYFTNVRQLQSNKKNLELAEELFADAQNEFESGLTSTTDLLNAQNDLSNARNNFSTSLLNLKLAELSWKKASGNLLTEYTN